MVALVVLYVALLLSLAVLVVRRLLQVNARLRSNLAGCIGYPVSLSSRRAAAQLVPLRVGQSRAPERAVSAV